MYNLSMGDKMDMMLIKHILYLALYKGLHICCRMRGEGLGRLAWFLAHENESARKLPQFSQLKVENLTNLLIIDQPRDLSAQLTNIATFKVVMPDLPVDRHFIFNDWLA